VEVCEIKWWCEVDRVQREREREREQRTEMNIWKETDIKLFGVMVYKVTTYLENTDMHRLTMGIRSEKCVVRRSCRCVRTSWSVLSQI
jgi:hypothetical protein